MLFSLYASHTNLNLKQLRNQRFIIKDFIKYMKSFDNILIFCKRGYLLRLNNNLFYSLMALCKSMYFYWLFSLIFLFLNCNLIFEE